MQVNHAGFTQIVGSTMHATCVAEDTRQPSARANSSSSLFTSNSTLGKTPVKVHILSKYLNNYKDKTIVLNGFTHGFNLHYSGPRYYREAKNLKSIYEHPQVAQEKIAKEVSLQRVGGPFNFPPFPSLQISPLGLVPKKDGDYRLIHHLSYPEFNSINHFIDPSACSVHYASVDDAAAIVATLGSGTLLAKSDVKSAFRLLPVACSDFELLGFKFNTKYYYDKMMPFGASISCATWERFATALHWIIQNKSRNPHILHYLDDFLFAGSGNSDQCKSTLALFKQICQDIGVPLALEKTTEPSTTMTFLGIEFDTTNMIMRLPNDKLDNLKQTINLFLHRKKATLKSVQSLIGLLNFACKTIAPGRAFCRRLIDATIGIKKQHHKVRITQDIKSDLIVWQQFLRNFNGITLITSGIWTSDTTLQFFTDSAGGPNGGFGVYFAGSWAHSKWPADWAQSGVVRDMTFLELFPVYVALSLWCDRLSNKRILFHIDNMAVVQILNISTSKSPRVMGIVRKLILITLQYNITIKAQYIPSKHNSVADSISRSQWGRFRKLVPDADVWPTPIPIQIWQI